MTQSLDMAIWGHLAAAAGFSVLAVVLLLGWGGRRAGLATLLAAVGTALWAAVVALHAGTGLVPTWAMFLAEVVRSSLWLLTLCVILQLVTAGRRRLPVVGIHPIYVLPVLVFVAGAAVILWQAFPDPSAVGSEAGVVAQEAGWTLSPGFLIWGIGAAIGGLFLIENLFTAGDRNTRWRTKHLLLGIGGAIFAYDLFLYSEGLLLQGLGGLTYLSRPLVNLLAVPLIVVSAVRIRDLSFDVSISREFIFRTSTLIICGLYLIAIALTGFLVREVGLSWGPMLQLAWLFGAVLALVALISSHQLRARLRDFMSRSFFTFHYDYRKEWLRFVETISGHDGDGAPLYERAVRSIAEPLSCSSGCLYLVDRKGTLFLAARYFWRPALALPALSSAVAEQLRLGDDVVDLRRDQLSPELVQVGDTLSGSWLLVPIPMVEGKLRGVVVLANPRTPRALTWEDRSLLAVLADQVASYLAEEQTTRALLEAQRFQKISKGFSFVAHDLKNITSQLSVMLQQAKKHGSNPEFQADVIETVALSVEKMKATLVRLNQSQDGEEGTADRVRLSELVNEAARRRGSDRGRIEVVSEAEELYVAVDPTGYTAVLDNLLVNAAEASPEEQSIVVRVGREETFGVVRVEDRGCGMTQDFIKNELFQPFISTKPGGFGLGMYQCRELVESWNGTLEVESVPKEGTTVSLKVPLSGKDDESATPSAAA